MSELVLPQPFDYQWNIINHHAKYKLMCCGRQVGKTTTLEHMLILGNRYHPGALYQKGHYLIVSPDYKQLKNTLLPLLTHDLKDISYYNKTDVEFMLVNGSRISCKTGENPDAIRGGTYSGCIIDEAAFISQEVYTQAIVPALEVKQGWIYLATTPDGFNWISDLWNTKQYDNSWGLFNMPSWASPLQSREKIELHKSYMPIAHWNQEYGGEFTSSADALFNPEWFEAITIQALPGSYKRSVVAVDFSLGKLKSDYQAAVFCGWRDGITYIDPLITRTSVTCLLDSVALLYDKYKPEAIVWETNAMGAVALDEFHRRYHNIPIYEQHNTESKKGTRIMRLSLPLSRRELRVLDNHYGKLLIQQMREFPSPDCHDDGPDALEMGLRYFADIPLQGGRHEKR